MFEKPKTLEYLKMNVLQKVGRQVFFQNYLDWVIHVGKGGLVSLAKRLKTLELIFKNIRVYKFVVIPPINVQKVLKV